MTKRVSQVQRVLNTNIETFEKMTHAELAHEVSILASAANKRIRRLEKAGYNTPALRYTMAHGGTFSVKGKNKTELLAEMKRASGFLGAKTSSVSGAKKSVKAMNVAIQKAHPEEEIPEMTKEEIDRFWEAVDKIRASQPVTFNQICLQYVGKIEKYVERGRSSGQIASYIKKAINKAEQEQMKKVSAIDKEIEKYTSPIGGNALGENHL